MEMMIPAKVNITALIRAIDIAITAIITAIARQKINPNARIRNSRKTSRILSDAIRNI
jgi:hypothetical protein